VSADPVFRKSVADLVQSKRRAAEAPAWFQKTYAQSPLTCVAYFSMEYMLSEALPSIREDLAMWPVISSKPPAIWCAVVGVGLLYQQGYFRQMIDKDGAQQALFPYNDPGQLPITPLRYRTGSGCGWRSRYLVTRLAARLAGQVGRVKLYLLDSNDAANSPFSEGLPASCMVAGRICDSSRSCSSGLADGGCSPHSASNRKFVI